MTMELARNWRLRQTRYRLEGVRCVDCGHLMFPARMLCPTCRSRNLVPHRFDGKGDVYSFSTVYQAPAGFEGQAPYILAVVRLEEGPMVTAQLTDLAPEDVYIGMKVEMVTRKLFAYGDNGVIVYGYKFRPPVLRPMNGHAHHDALHSTAPEQTTVAVTAGD